MMGVSTGPAPCPEGLSPGFLVGGSWGEADKVGTGQRVGPMKAGTCLVGNKGAKESEDHWRSTAVVEGGRAWGARSLVSQAFPLLGAGKQGHRYSAWGGADRRVW